MAITVTIDDLNIPAYMKEDAQVQEEIAGIIAQVLKIVFMYFTFTDADMTSEAVEDFKTIIIWESQTRFFYRGKPDGDKPGYGGVMYSSEAYNLWKQYL